jgi:hypothetical protein
MGMLPTKRTPPVTDLGAFKTLIYGATKAGKTTLASQYPSTVFLATEPGCKALSTYSVTVDSWSDFLAASKELAAGGHGFQTVVIDTIDLLWKYCHESVLRSMGLDMEPGNDFGRTGTRIKSEFHRELAKLAGLPMGLVIISHDTEREIKPKGRMEGYTLISPSLSSAPRGIVMGMMDLIFYLEAIPEIIEGKLTGRLRRQLRTKPGNGYDAGDRTGRLPDPLEPTYAALREALRVAVGECAAVVPEVVTPIPEAPATYPESLDNPPESPARPTVPTPVSRRRG